MESSFRIRRFYISVFLILLICINHNAFSNSDTTFCTHQVILDEQGKIVPWYSPAGNAYDHFLNLRWNFIKTRVPLSPGPSPRSLYPQYYFYCAFKDREGDLEPDTWMNDIGEKIPNWFESARLYYAYTGDSSVMGLVKKLIDYTLVHGTSASGFTWSGIPYTTSNAGDTIFRGFTSSGRFARHEIQVDHAGEVGLTYLRMFQYTLEDKYLKAAIQIADVLAKNATEGNARQSVWPYRVIMDKGTVTAPYGANWTGCYQLLDDLIRNNFGNVDAYKTARDKAGRFLLQYPMKTGYWTDGHSDNNVNSNTYKSNLSASNVTLFLFDHPGFDPEWKIHIPMLIKWTEDNFVTKCTKGEPASMWGANLVGEQDGFLYKMDYQTARYAAECARWFAISGDNSYKEKAYRSLNWVTYCNDTSGMAFESPISKGILSWWSDSYGECPRMFYQAFAGIPEWAPPRENHILYSAEVLTDVRYSENLVAYSASSPDGKEYVRLAFRPKVVSLNGQALPLSQTPRQGTWTLRDLEKGDFAIEISRQGKGDVIISGSETRLNIDITTREQQITGIGVNANTRSWNGNELKPAIDMLADSMNFRVWRVIAETVEKWEVENDNDDPFSFNLDYYNQLYETPKFRKIWDMMEYLNVKGIKENLMLNLMGRLPAWMGDSIILPDKEDEYVEMVASFLYYAKNTKRLQFGLFGPMNEPDIRKEGPTVGPKQYAAVIRKLVDRMNSLDLGDIKLVAPDVAGMNNGIKQYLPLLFADPVIMASLGYAGLHSYAGYYAPASEFLKRSAYPTTPLWMTECNAWRNGLDDGVIGVYDFNYARECVAYIISLIKNGAGACILWEGYDSYYEHHAPSAFSYWGILGFDPGTRTYFPRKHFYAISQVSKFIPQGSWQLALHDSSKMTLAAFFDEVSGRITLVGINTKPSPEFLSVGLLNASGLGTMEMYVTGESDNFTKLPDVEISTGALSTTIPANCIFTLTGKIGDDNLKAHLTRPEPHGWYSGDMHVHRNCGEITPVIAERELAVMMKPNDLSVVALLADMGNGEVKDRETDLPRVTGKDAKESGPGRIIHWDAEWHFDPAGVTFEKKALGGHLVFLGLKEAHTIWNESPFNIIEWGRKQNAVIGFCHMEYLNDRIPDKLDCCTPLDFPVEAALGTIDFLAEDVWVNDAALNAYYRLLNCGFRLGWAAGTDYPCNGGQPFGTLLTWVNLKDQPLSYRGWIDGIKNGRTVVSTNGNSEFLDLKVNKTAAPGDEIRLTKSDSLDVEVIWTTTKEITGWIEIIQNGKVVARQDGASAPGTPLKFKSRIGISGSSWVCARRMNEKGHQSHTAPVYITVHNQPVRANAEDPQFFIRWIDNLLSNTEPGNKWFSYVSGNNESIRKRYIKAKKVYSRIAREAQRNQNRQGKNGTRPILILGTDSGFGSYISEILKTEGVNEYEIDSLNNPGVNLSFLMPFNLVILGSTKVDPADLKLLARYLRKGGNLIAFEPDSSLDEIFGIASLSGKYNEGYLAIDTLATEGKGLTGKLMQFHGPAKISTATSGKIIAKLYPDPVKNVEYPAVVKHRYGKGYAIAFMYNLPQSIVYMRQGNPALAGRETDSIPGIRAMDLFTNGWIDTSMSILNQADEQMRFLSHCIETICNSSLPLPRLWYFPDTLQCLIVLTNDGEYRQEADFEKQFTDIDSAGAKMTLYVLETGKVSKDWTSKWVQKGFEISGHPDDTHEAAYPTGNGVKKALETKKREVTESFGLPMKTVANHWFVWCGKDMKGNPDFSSQAEVEAAAGLKLDANYAHYDNNAVQPRFLGSTGYCQGNFTGSGLSMKFAGEHGKVLDIYQFLTNVYDQQYMENKDAPGYFDCFMGLLNRSLYEGVFSIIGIKAHNDEYFFSKEPLLKMLAVADSLKIPVWTAEKLQDFLEMKDTASFSRLNWGRNAFSFVIKSPIPGTGALTLLLPLQFKSRMIIKVVEEEKEIPFLNKRIKGRSYAMITVESGKNHAITAEYR